MSVLVSVVALLVVVFTDNTPQCDYIPMYQIYRIDESSYILFEGYDNLNTLILCNEDKLVNILSHSRRKLVVLYAKYSIPVVANENTIMFSVRAPVRFDVLFVPTSFIGRIEDECYVNGFSVCQYTERMDCALNHFFSDSSLRQNVLIMAEQIGDCSDSSPITIPGAESDHISYGNRKELHDLIRNEKNYNFIYVRLKMGLLFS